MRNFLNGVAVIFLFGAVILYAYDWTYGVIHPNRAVRHFLVVWLDFNPLVAIFGTIGLVALGIIACYLTLPKRRKPIH